MQTGFLIYTEAEKNFGTRQNEALPVGLLIRRKDRDACRELCWNVRAHLSASAAAQELEVIGNRGREKRKCVKSTLVTLTTLSVVVLGSVCYGFCLGVTHV